MGSPATEEDRRDNEGPQRQVTVSSFYMGVYEVTQRLWGAYTPRAGGIIMRTYGENHPVTNVSWFDAVLFANELSLREGLTPAYTISRNNVTWNRQANGYRLPTEAEWEFAVRAGTTTPWNTGTTITQAQANFRSNGIVAVGSFAPNAWGLYDMHGNVWEWCWDWYDTYPSTAQINPVGASSGTNRVDRGGAWNNSARFLRSAFRSGTDPSHRGDFTGFRLVRNVHE